MDASLAEKRPHDQPLQRTAYSRRWPARQIKKEENISYLYLAIAIISEVIATNALKVSEEFTKLAPSIIVVIGYVSAFYFLSLVLKTIPVGITYALWAGAGIALMAIVAAIVFKQTPDLPAIIGMVLIVSGGRSNKHLFKNCRTLESNL